MAQQNVISQNLLLENLPQRRSRNKNKQIKCIENNNQQHISERGDLINDALRQYMPSKYDDDMKNKHNAEDYSFQRSMSSAESISIS